MESFSCFNPGLSVKKKLEEYESFKNWLLSVAPSTQRTYRHFMVQFCEYMKLDPKELLRVAQKSRAQIHIQLKEF
jgi:hypothetical protein